MGAEPRYEEEGWGVLTRGSSEAQGSHMPVHRLYKPLLGLEALIPPEE